MKRQIKFKALRQRDKKEIQGFPCLFGSFSTMFDEDGNEDIILFETLKQFVGANQRGEDVWESDKNSKGESIEWNFLHNGWYWFKDGSAQREVLSEVYDDKGQICEPYIMID